MASYEEIRRLITEAGAPRDLAVDTIYIHPDTTPTLRSLIQTPGQSLPAVLFVGFPIVEDEGTTPGLLRLAKNGETVGAVFLP